MIDHITFEVPPEYLYAGRMTDFIRMLGFIEVDASEEVNMGYDVRWFVHTEIIPAMARFEGTKRGTMLKPELHLVAGGYPAPLGMTHFCVTGVGEEMMEHCRKSEWLEHEREGSGRLWVQGPGGLRVEVRP